MSKHIQSNKHANTLSVVYTRGACAHTLAGAASRAAVAAGRPAPGRHWPLLFVQYKSQRNRQIPLATLSVIALGFRNKLTCIRYDYILYLANLPQNIFFSQVSKFFQHPFKFDNFTALSAALSSCTYDRYLP